MLVDNFDKIEKMLDLDHKGEFYFVQILQRAKDGRCEFDQSNNNSTRVIKSYFISTREYYKLIQGEIKALCKLFNARAYISLNKKSYGQIGLKMMRLLAEYIETGYTSGDFSGIKNLFESACGQVGACDKKKSWILDVDTLDESEINEVINALNQCEPFDTEKLIGKIPTLHGVHLITRPFNKDRFKKLYTKPIDIKENNPTVLYYFKNEY